MLPTTSLSMLEHSLPGWLRQPVRSPGGTATQNRRVLQDPAPGPSLHCVIGVEIHQSA